MSCQGFGLCARTQNGLMLAPDMKVLVHRFLTEGMIM